MTTSHLLIVVVMVVLVMVVVVMVMMVVSSPRKSKTQWRERARNPKQKSVAKVAGREARCAARPT